MKCDSNKKITVDNAVIMAAGTSSRFAPLSFERPKSLYEVRGEVLIERQIRQLMEAGIQDVIIVVGYLKEQFAYLRKRFGVKIVENPDYLFRNNNSTIHAVKNHLNNTYICSSDNYFSVNPFEREVSGAYYAACYARGKTSEWCISEGEDGFIDTVTVGGRNSWYMMGHVFWDETFSRKFVEILDAEYDNPLTAPKLWESIYSEHLDELKLKIRKYPRGVIEEFDSLDELRLFDESYVENTRSEIVKNIAAYLKCSQGDICNISPAKENGSNEASGFTFSARLHRYFYSYSTGQVSEAD
ncbi:MAG: NTP transferase domain-containing protein [Clostridia bacterium]|nr:NTP transferase domain-containing protein [Clostridia bacterium]